MWEVENCVIQVREYRGIENGNNVGKEYGKNSAQMGRNADRALLRERRKKLNVPGVQCQEFGPKDSGIKI